MQIPTTHLRPLPRRYPHAMPVSTIGYIPVKTDWVHNTFRSFNFSFILSGHGEYRLNGRVWEVRTPCVITQWPDKYVEYGPEKKWEELYIIYEPVYLDLLRRCGFAREDHPVWYIEDPAPVRRRLAELRHLLQTPQAPGHADEIDRVSESMVLSSLLSQDRPPLDDNARAVEQVREHLREHFAEEEIDLDELALEVGLSPSTFRRVWATRVGMPPAKYVTHLRMRQACRMLAETRTPVGEIARLVGYADVLYFSRRFREEMKITATDYRKAHGTPLSLPQVDE